MDVFDMFFLPLPASMGFFALTAAMGDPLDSNGEPIHTSVASIGYGKTCFNVTVPVTVTSTNFIWGSSQFETDYDVAAFTAAFANVTLGANLSSFAPIAGTQIETASYNIAGTYCKPLSSSDSTLLLATHGLTLNRYYWDSGYQPSNYSFVDYAIGKGYSIFYYDRLGAGESTKVSGYVNNGNIQVAILEQLVKYIRGGKLSTACIPVKPKKVILLGHSYGSVLSNALLAANPDIADGAVLTGWNYAFNAPFVVASVQLRIANQLRPAQYKGYDTGAVCFVDVYASIQLFYKGGAFDPEAAQWPYDIASPVAIMELMSLATMNYASPNVTVPVMFLSGEDDNCVCGGYCGDVLPPAAKEMFPHASGFEVYLQPGTGHNLNFHYNATGTYSVITNFLAKNGL